MIKHLNITGVDAVGKTTIINEIIKRNIPSFKTFRAPLYHENSNFPKNKLSRAVSQLNQLANDWNNPSLKGYTLFLGMTVFKFGEEYYSNQKDVKVLISERSPLLDSLSYLEIYRDKLQSIDPSIADSLWSRITKNMNYFSVSELEMWIESFFNAGSFLKSFRYSLELLKEFSFLNKRELINPLISLFHYQYPTYQIYLEASPQMILMRLKNRKCFLNHTLEWHEDEDRIFQLQKSYKNTTELLFSVKSDQFNSMDAPIEITRGHDFRFLTLRSDLLSVSEIVDQLIHLSLLELNSDHNLMTRLQNYSGI